MSHWLRQRSLVTQILMAGIVITSMVFVAIYWYQSKVVKQTIYTLAQSHATHSAPMVSAALSTAIAQSDFASLQAIVAESVSKEGIAEITVTDAQGKVLAHAGEVTPDHTMLVNQVALSLGGQSLGIAKLIFTDEVAADLLGELAIKRLLVFFVTLAIVCAGLVYITRLIVRPLHALSSAAKAMSQGEYGTQFKAPASQEVHELQVHFSRMAQDVQSQIAAVQASDALQKQYLALAQVKIDETELARSSAEAAQKAAEAANRAKSQFLNKVSHEIRTPLNGMLGMLELLRDSRLDPSQKELAGIAHDSGESLLAIINDILDFSKVEMGEFVIDKQNFNVHALLHSVGQLFSVVASRKGLTLECDIEELVPTFALGDSLRLRQILSNLIGNAIKFTDRGHVRLSAWFQTSRAMDALPGTVYPIEPEAVGQLYLRISDTGMGIAPEALEQIFAPFVQADNSPTRRFGGTGLGLSIVKSLAQAMGGGVSVSSTPYKGSTFTVRVPIGIAQAPTSVEAKTPAKQNTALTGMRVLVVEDNEINLKLALRIIAKFGCLTDFAMEGRQALEKIVHHSFDAVLMDCQMPVMDGLEASAAIRERERTLGLPRLPIIAVTANAREADRQACMAHGMDDCLSKPYAAHTLNQALMRFYSETAVQV